jgi:hypothetical protein
MKINQFFEKDIHRNIETVIKADDRENISDEVAEYVITHEIGNKIRDFFSSYNEYAGANGVWISGFFGSGKSHLLKILSYVLENKEFDGYYSGELFSEKIENDQILKADVISASKVPSESILFNIDQQAQITSKANEDAILKVFYKVFYDHQGFYGFQPHVAEFEFWLQKNGQLADFEAGFNAKSDTPWENARNDYFDPKVTDALAEILGELNGKDAAAYEDILDQIEDKSKQSIDDFCERVMDYIKSKGPHFRLNFFVDEIGQYISDNTKLMLNLQTIAETLATKTKGRSWILVTSQEDMEKVVGDMSKSQQNDFSRIQARFKVKIPLTSANVDEVIEKRLLKKSPEATELLKDLYAKEHAHISTLISFSDSGVQFKGLQGDKDFVNKYPFLPYQFDLFQQCRRALSAHNAFQGKHASVGERSMLGVFQQVIKSIGENGEKTLVGFDKMYEGIRNELRGEIQSSVIMAERNLSSDFAIRVLKTLFLVKYFSNFKPTKRNISVLLIDSMEMDLKGHEAKVQEALNLLENQSYIQRNGEIFEFLTDDEKDIEQEIKDTDIDDQAVIQQLKELFFDEIIKDSKIPYADNKQSYDFTSKIDGASIGREKELAVEIISENYADYSNTTYIASQTMGSSMMRLVLPSNAIFIKDLKMYLKTNKYIKQSQSTSSKVERRRIIQDKQVQNSERRRNLILLSNQLLAGSDVYINGTKQEMGTNSDGKSRVVQAFQILVKTVYSNLRMLGLTTYTEDTIKQILNATQNELFKIEQTLTEAETEILTIINRRKMRSDRSSLSELKDILGSKPYGWYPNAVWSVTAKLYKRGQIELKQDSNMLEGGDVLQAFLNSAQYSNTLVQAQEAEDPGAVRALKALYADFLDESCPFTIGKEMALSFKEKLREVLRETERFYVQRSEYPFLSALASPLEKLKNLVSKDYMQLLSQVKSYQDELLDFKELLLDPIKRFMNSEQCGIYDEIRKTLNGDKSNFEYTTGDELEILRQLLDHPKPYEGSLIREAKAAKDSLAEKVISKIDEERKLTSETIYTCVNTLKSETDFEKLSPSEQADILEPFSEETKKVQNQRYIAILRESRSRIKNVILTNQLNEINRKSHVPETGVGEKPRAEIVKVISVGSVKVSFPKSQLKTDADVDAYVEELREEFKKQIQNNRRISL